MGSGLHWGSPPVECAAISASLNAPPPATTAGGGGGGGGGTTDGGGGNGGGGATTAPASSGTGAGAGTGGTGTSGGSSSPTITLAALDSPTLYPPGMGSAVGTVTSSSSSGAGAATGGAEPQTSTPSSVPIAAVAGGAAAAAALVAVLLTVLVVVLLRRRRQRADEKGGAVVAFGDRAYGGGGGGGGGATSAGALRPPGYGGYGGYDGYGAQQSPDVPSSAGGGAGLDSPVPLVPPAVAPFEYDRPRHALPVVVDVTGVAAAAGTAASPTGAQTYVYAIHGDARAGAYVSGGSGGNGVGGGSPDKMFGEKHGYSGSGVLWAGGGAGVAAQAAGTAAGSGEVEVAPPPSLAHGLTVSGGALPSYTEVSGEGFVGGSSAVPRVTVTSKPPLVAPARLASMVGGAKGLGDR
ncbi:hypothetical protein DFJ73DRAFT_802505 [Zopfochytrium polystomum]|nr:hypothetical protein DFJ73DRAFT_802505 [Zopfochytrium polystomum]